jgi:lysophospholipase L1-like esterase
VLVVLLLIAIKHRHRSNQVLARLSLSMVTLLTVWILCDIALVIFHDEHPFNHTRRPDLQRTYYPSEALMPGVTGVSTFTTNSLGIRAPEFPENSDDYKVLCIGGSTTECLYLDDEETWPHLLCDSLNQMRAPPRVFWVGNAGITGHSSIHHLRFVENSPIMERLNCVIFLVGINDFVRSDLFISNASSNAAIVPLWRRSRLLDLSLKSGWWHRLVVEDAAGNNYQLRRKKRADAENVDSPLSLDYDLDQFATRIARSIEVCRSKQVLPVFVTQPTLWEENLSATADNLLWFGALPNGKYLSTEKLRLGLDQYNHRLIRVCEDLGAHLVDASSMNARECFFYDDCHFTEAGAQRMAHLIANSLSQMSHFGNKSRTDDSVSTRLTYRSP